MSLISRIVAPAIGEEKIPSHQFTSLLAEYRRGTVLATKEKIIEQFSITAEELPELDAILEDFLASRTSREQIHDALMLGEYGAYTPQQTQHRIAATGQQTDLEALTVSAVARIQNLAGSGDFVLRGCNTLAQSTPDMSVKVLSGSVLTNNRVHSIVETDLAIAAADTSLPRIDLIRVDPNGVLGVTTGTPALQPKPPTVLAGEVALEFVFVAPGETTITGAALQDVRVLRSWGPIRIGSRNNPLTISNNAGVTTLFAQTVPALMLTTRAVRMRVSGYFLFNSVGNEPEVDFRVRFGSTVLWLDYTPTFVASPSRQPFLIDIELFGAVDGSQVLSGTITVANHSAPNIGSGAINDDDVVSFSTIGGFSTEDISNDLIFNVATRMSIADENNTTVVDYAMAELI